MKISLVALLFFLLTATTTLCQAQDCIKTLVDLERSILSNDENIQSLTDAFYPANKHPAVYVKVQYYINGTDNNATTFYWVSSPVFGYAYPYQLQWLSLNFVTFDLHVTDLVISPFCNESSALPILTQATTWIKSYATRRISSVMEGVDRTLQGYTLDIPDNESNNSTAFNVIFGILLGLFLPFGVNIYLHSMFYTGLYNKTKERPHRKGQKFKFKNKFWAGIVVLASTNIVIILADFLSLRQFNESAILFCVLLTIPAAVCAMLLTVYYRAKPIDRPDLPAAFKQSSCCKWIFQFFFFQTLLNSSQLARYHVCGLLLALLVDPIQVSVKAMLCILMLTFAHFLYTQALEYWENYHGKWKCWHVIAVFGASYLCLNGVLFFLVYISNAYINVIQFATGSAMVHAVNSLTQIFPAVLIAISGWLLKKQYDNFVGKNDDDELVDVEANKKIRVSVGSREDIDEDNDEQQVEQDLEMTTLIGSEECIH